MANVLLIYLWRLKVLFFKKTYGSFYKQFRKVKPGPILKWRSTLASLKPCGQ